MVSEAYMRDLIKEMRASRNLQESIIRDNAKSMDRVNISLTEYDRMRDDIKSLNEEICDLINEKRKLIDILNSFGITKDIVDNIDLESVITEKSVQECSLKTSYHISFNMK